MDTQTKPERALELQNLFSIWKRRKEKIRNRTDKAEFPFGIKKLDDITHGITKGKVTVIAGRTSEAKTSFALQGAFNIANTGKTVLYITLEDDSEQIAERIFSNIMEVDNQALIQGMVSDEILDSPAMEKIFKSVKFVPVQDFGHNFDEIKKTIESINPKPDIVFIDYVQMIEQLPRESEYEALSRFSQQLKKFAEKNDVGLVIISQINRSGAKDGRPQAHHLQGCGRLEQVCDLLLILYCPFNSNDSSFDGGMEECPRDYVEVIIAKNKNGQRNWVVPTRFTGKYYKFTTWEVEDTTTEKDFKWYQK